MARVMRDEMTHAAESNVDDDGTSFLLQAKLCLQARSEFGRERRNAKARAGHELAARYRALGIVVGKSARNTAILALLIPAKTREQDCFGTNELETAEQGILVGNQEGVAQNRNFNQLFVRTKRSAHVASTPGR
jgi:hypothetical protein